MLLVVGLGNPGKKYERTYHNAGALVLSRLGKETKEKMGARQKGETDYFQFAEFKAPAGGRFVFIWPKTYMNESGLAVRAALKFFKAKPEEILVLHDDSDLPLGEGKFTNSKNPAGHRGLISIQKETGLSDFQRFRIGIRDPQEKSRRKAEDFVLKTIPGTKLELLRKPELFFGSLGES